MLVRSVPMRELLPWSPGVVELAVGSTEALKTLNGKLSRLPPQREDGARARTDASVSMERRLRRLPDDARVRMEALSVKRPLAVAAE